MVDEQTRANLIAEHYRDTCKAVSKQLATRNKELIWLFALFALTMLNAYYPDLFSQIVPQWLKLEGTTKVPLPTGFAGFILLFAIMLVLGDIYNLSVVIERNLIYLRNLEAALGRVIGDGVISRYQTSLKARPKLMVQSAIFFSVGFSAINSVLILAILWGDSHTRNQPAGRWFFILVLLVGAVILYMSGLFISSYLQVVKKAANQDQPPPNTKTAEQGN